MPETGLERRKRIAANLARLKELGAPPEDVQAYLAEERVEPDLAAERTTGSRVEDIRAAFLEGVPFANRAHTGLQAYYDLMRELEVKSPDEAMAEQRAGVERVAAAPGPGALALQMTSGAAIPFGLLKQVAKVPGVRNLLNRAATRAGNLLTTGAAYGASSADLRGDDVSTGAAGGGQAALLTDVGMGLLGAGGRGLRTMTRMARSDQTDRLAFALKDAMSDADAILYGAVEREAGASGSSPAIRAALKSQTIRPFANRIRASETHAGASDAKVFLEAYKGMSEAQRGARGAMEGTADFLHGRDLLNRDIVSAKARMQAAAVTPGEVVVPGRAVATPVPSTAQSPHPTLREALDAHRARSAAVAARAEGIGQQQRARTALERLEAEQVVSPSLSGAPAPGRAVVRESQTIPLSPALPTFPEAVATHARRAGELDAFTNTMEDAARLLSGTRNRGNTVLLKSREAFRRRIAEMTEGEARAALPAMHALAREEAWRLTSNPLTLFNVVPSVARTAKVPGQINEFVQLLEAKAGIVPRRGLLELSALGRKAVVQEASRQGGLLP